MRKSRFSEEQIIGMIKEQEAGLPTVEVCRKHGLSPATFYKLKGKYGGMEVSEVRRERPPDHAKIREDMRDIAAKRRRFGYRRVGVMLERKGHVMNHKKLYRLYREEGLSVSRRRGRKRARGSRTPIPVPLRPNDRWSMDFVADTFGASRRLRILAINDDCCRENLCLLGDTSISGVRVARELDTLVRLYGKPGMIVSDNVLGREAAAGNGQQVSLRRS